MFVVVDCVRKLMLTGMLIFVLPGSGTQLGIAVLLSMIFKEIVATSGPYVEDANDRLANVGQLQITLVFLNGMLLLFKDADQQAGAAGGLTSGPIFSGTMALISLMYVSARKPSLARDFRSTSRRAAKQS